MFFKEGLVAQIKKKLMLEQTTIILIKSQLKHYLLQGTSKDFIQGASSDSGTISPGFKTNKFIAAKDYNAKHIHWSSR